MGAAADTAMRARVDSLLQESRAQGFSPEDTHARVASDPYLNALALLPRQSGIESTIESLRDMYNGSPYGVSRGDIPPGSMDSPDARTIDQLLSGQGFNDPSGQPQFYLDTNRRGEPEFITPMDDFLRYGGRDEDSGMRFFGGYAPPSYGQTDQPAPEVRFDKAPGGANGGLAALIRRQHAQRQR